MDFSISSRDGKICVSKQRKTLFKGNPFQEKSSTLWITIFDSELLEALRISTVTPLSEQKLKVFFWFTTVDNSFSVKK